jgi:hypothetical protein
LVIEKLRFENYLEFGAWNLGFKGFIFGKKIYETKPCFANYIRDTTLDQDIIKIQN